MHALICKAGSFDLFRKKCLIPNERGTLCLLHKLSKDGNIDPALKDIADLLATDVRAQLVHPGITTSEVLAELSTLSEEDVLTKLLDLIRQRTRDNPITESTQSANVQLFGWLIKKNKTVKLDNFPVLTVPDTPDKTGIFILRATASASERPLAPIAQWPEPAKPYADLLPGPAILHPRYAEAIPEPPHWQTLASNGYLHLSPLYQAESTVREFLPDENLSEEDLNKRTSETPQKRTEITWLTGDERSILSRARSSQTRALRLLKFILDYVLPADPHALDIQAALCDDDKEHRFYRANWLSLLRTRIWVGKASGAPSAENFAKLLAQDQKLLNRLTDPPGPQLLEALAVSPADLMLRSVGQDGAERMSLIQSVAVIKSVVGNDAEKVKALAGALQQDPEVLNIVRERQARRETVHRNQALGDLAERLFVEAFAGTDLVTKRTGTGHDFSIQPPAGEEEDAGQIQLTSPAGSVFVEIKATITGGARMSAVQVGQAVMNKDHYFLCVVPGAEAVLGVEAFKAKAKFVTNIGDRFQHLHSQYLKMEIDLGLTPKTDAGLAIEVTGHQVKFRVDEEVWSAGLDFSATLDLLKSRLLPPAHSTSPTPNEHIL